MKKEPRIDYNQLKEVLKRDYNLSVTSIKYIPKGADADAYLVNTKENNKIFVKLYDMSKVKKFNLKFHIEDFIVLNILHKKYKIENISYPILSKNDKIDVRFGKYRLVVTNFIQGKNDEKLLTDIQLSRFAILLARIHKVTGLNSLIKHKESFNPTYFKDLESALKRIDDGNFNKTPFQVEVSALIGQHISTIKSFVKKTMKLSIDLHLDERDYKITHTDPYFLNIIKTKDEVYLIDWDAMQLGPKEQDIWFYLIRGICNKPLLFLKEYKKIYGEFKLNKKIVHYYIQNRILEDLNHYLQEIYHGNEDKTFIDEIINYSLKWIIDNRKMLVEVDKIIDKWNEINNP